MTDLSKSQLNTILSALDGKQRNPNTKDAALKAIGCHGERLGLALDDILGAAAGLLDGRMSAEDFVTELQGQPTAEPQHAKRASRIRPRPELAMFRPDEIAETWPGVSKDLYHALWAAMHYLPKYDGETPPEPDLLAVTRVWKHFTTDAQRALNVLAKKRRDAARAEEDAEEAESGPDTGAPAKQPKQRYGTKQATMIEMLSRAEGATVDQIAEVTGWQRHTVRGAIAGALKKKLGMTITTEKVSTGEGQRGSYTVYRIQPTKYRELA